uniref:RNA helicase n=1 Tax=Strongyloides papillosus TaxID=174720 RepID=A0A0N5BWD0_STREA
MSEFGLKDLLGINDEPSNEYTSLQEPINLEFNTDSNKLLYEPKHKSNVTSVLSSIENLRIIEEINKNVGEIIEKHKSMFFTESSINNFINVGNSEKDNDTNEFLKNYSGISNKIDLIDNLTTDNTSLIDDHGRISNNSSKNLILTNNEVSNVDKNFNSTYELDQHNLNSDDEQSNCANNNFENYKSKDIVNGNKKSEHFVSPECKVYDFASENYILEKESTTYNHQKFKDKTLGSNYIPIVRDFTELLEEDKNDISDYINVNRLDDNITVEYSSSGDIKNFYSWEECNLNDKLLSNILKAGYVKPRKIQSVVIPYIMQGIDVKVHSENGTGKTVAYLVPIINSMLKNGFTRQKTSPHALIIAPVRELAVQIFDQARKLCFGIEIFCNRLYGQTNINYSKRCLNEGCDILICTPGRLRDFVEREILILKNVKYLVYDEADRLLEHNFNEDMKHVIFNMNKYNIDKRITALFSSTFNMNLEQFARRILRNNFASITNSRFNEVNKKIMHNIINATRISKDKLICTILEEEMKIASEYGLKMRKTIIFVEKKIFAHILATFLVYKGVNACSINGDYSQEVREQILLDFRNNKFDVIVTTDVCARGMDIHNLDHVINFSLPKNIYTFINRVGRVGRIRDGDATSFYDSNTDGHLKDYLVKILKESSNSVPDFLL